MAKKEVWGHPKNESIREYTGGWFIGTREFVCQDGTSFWQMKTARTRTHFSDPRTGYMCWKSKINPRYRKDFASREEAWNAAVEEIKAYETKKWNDAFDKIKGDD